ncbi:hypothetical protein E2C01_080852 [Portunus trituberculatus]|uniref:Uncharacterized protein n=1 Tax=Portunus trituberculatus TaxID=210409 RepID=A0A5B7INB9_PORTR|nr:hypothetical protein [Portunus trituberculatus]
MKKRRKTLKQTTVNIYKTPNEKKLTSRVPCQTKEGTEMHEINRIETSTYKHSAQALDELEKHERQTKPGKTCQAHAHIHHQLHKCNNDTLSVPKKQSIRKPYPALAIHASQPGAAMRQPGASDSHPSQLTALLQPPRSH